jgi:tRNA (guanine-N7-)-methyltransferase
MADRAAAQSKGLVGGTAALRLRRGRPVSLAHALFINPVLGREEEERLAEFCRAEELLVEVGFGKGGFLAELAKGRPRSRVLGVEVRRKYCLLTLARLEREGVENARVVLGDARELLPRYLSPESVDELYVLFPDPWWKRRHHKRRLLSAGGVEALSRLLKPGAVVLVRTDVPLVAELAAESFEKSGRFAKAAVPAGLPKTDRERTCNEIGIPVVELCYRNAGKREACR